MARGWKGLILNEDGSQVFECPRDHCYYRVLLGPEVSAEHKCPRTGETRIGWSIQVTLLQQMWDHADEKYDELMLDKENPEKKQYLRGVAYALSIFMQPYFRTPDEIALELRQRYRARVKHEEYETPGLGALKYLPPDKWEPAKGGGYTSNPERRASAGTTAARNPGQTKVSHNFNDEEVAKIKTFAENGFAPEDLARINGVSVATINAVLAS